MTAILQFGTSRFLQAHVDLFIGEALAGGAALGPVTVVQTTDSADSAKRIAAFNQPGGYPVRIRGLLDGVVVDRVQTVASVQRGLSAQRDWAQVRELAAGPVQVMISNTGDRGYELSPDDHPGLLEGDVAPRSFPAKLLVLLHGRYLRGGAPVTLLPCELVAGNGTVLRECVLQLARDWGLGLAFANWLAGACVWVNSLVDRIVSEPIDPVGAVAEPYALWAIEAQPEMQLPCAHAQIVVTDRLEPYERRKLFLLNLGHSFLAECWLREERPEGETVLQALSDPRLGAELEALWEEEVLPVFRALGEEEASRAYLDQVRERFGNPYLAHRLADIAKNHEEKKLRRFQPVLALARELGLNIPQARLRKALERAATGVPVK
ncbi:mannitol dehydrogenase family protein [Pseudoduganella sp. UC29_106]|uniref:mannitol dehydrogenase family protein n=1 Tax=Pseudoduganella sp. UC29_106 TaxID=3374553 RepID=UPI0037575C4A